MKRLLLLIITITCIAQPLFGGKVEDLEKFRKTGSCTSCDLSEFNLTQTIKKLNEEAHSSLKCNKKI